MDIETTRAKMEEQLAQARDSAMAKAYRWTFETQDLLVYVSMQHRRTPGNTYLLKVGFGDFPRRMPSYVFVDPENRQLTASAWPPNVKHGAEPPGICTPGTREFHEHWHKNDKRYPPDPAQYTLLDTLQRIHRLLEQGLGG